MLLHIAQDIEDGQDRRLVEDVDKKRMAAGGVYEVLGALYMLLMLFVFTRHKVKEMFS